MQNRRKFIQHLSKATLLAGVSQFPLDALAGNGLRKITILHSNDVHSRIDPFPADDKKFANMGGMAQKAACIQRIREQEEHVLLFDAGDIFQGTPYFNFYHGELEMKLMSAMQYDAATMGNHDFDAGIDGFAEQLKHANFPILTANYVFDDTPLQQLTKQYKVFVKNNIRIGVFGLGIQLNGLVPKALYGNTQYLDPLETAQRMASILKNDEQCDLVICLSHLGYQYTSDKVSDVVIAQKTKNIDVIIGGHTHTFLQTPLIYNNLLNEQVIINQVGWAGVWLGRIDIYFEKSFGKKWHSGKPVIVS